MYIKIIACKILQRELASLLWKCPHTLDLTTIRQDYHMTPGLLPSLLQEEIDRVEDGMDIYTNKKGKGEIDAIVLGYGLCSNAVLGLKARTIPLVLPRAHDCTTFLLGDRRRYKELFESYKGAFYYGKSWSEVGKDIDEAYLQQKEAEFREKYDDDEDTVDYLMDIERSMLAHYKYAVYVSWPGFEEEKEKEETRKKAADKQWEYVEIEGSHRLLWKMINGQWDEEDFLIVKPGETVAIDSGDGIIKALQAR